MSIKTIVIASALIGFTTVAAMAGPKMDSLKACQADWKAEKAKPSFVKAPKGEGRAQYWTFVKQCRATKV